MHKPFLESRVLGCWRGKTAGGTLGLPIEGRTDRQSLAFYDPIPTVVPPNDDLELQLIWLELMEKHRGPLTIDAVAKAWIDHMHYMWDEYGRARWNLRLGVPPALCGIFQNHFASGMGSPIRSEVWAIAAAGKPELAEKFARLDSMIDHGAEGAAGEIFFAVMQSLVLSGSTLDDALEAAMARVESTTETRRALEMVFASFRAGEETWSVREKLLRVHGSENFTHAPLNVALTLWALLYGKGDFETSILLAANAGYDTDCTAATAGAVLGMLYGADGLPEKWIAPLGDAVTIGPGIIGIDWPQTLQDLTARSIALISRAEELTPVFAKPVEIPQVKSLSAAVSFHTSMTSVPWLNGELPLEVKACGGGTLEWKPGADIGKYFRIIALARDGCRLLVDGKPLVRCPAGLPYVPGSHRMPWESQDRLIATRETHEITLELNSSNPDQDASLMLVDASCHFAPWNGVELPDRATLPNDRLIVDLK